ncbi:MAG: Stp1/IreP family PP2C-type Ser/Thr phosphatase [Eubacterium sp.]|nr:Stp1/IreP family PP2C-type Ser/Thr phosphatase [Eubacterium sp.]
MKVVAKTDKGIVRDINEDAYNVGEFDNGVSWAVVCDGMGGAAAGNIASSLAAKVISERIKKGYHEKMRDASVINMLESAIIAANIEVYDLSRSRSELRGMGTTVVCAYVDGDNVIIAHAGDSRAYIVGDDDIRQVTTDHSMVQDLVKRGEITLEEAEHHPNKNIITRALGVDEELEIDFTQTVLNENEKLVLCTDGLSNYVSKSDIVSDLKDGQFYAYADRLVKRANSNGGGDNITVVVISN